MLKIKKLHKDAVLPKYATEGSAGLDITAIDDGRGEITSCGPIITFRTGLSIQLPKGHVGLLIPRSSISSKTSYSLANSVGVIDEDYTGEVLVKFRDFNEFYSNKVYTKGDRICQLVVVPVPRLEVVEVKELEYTERSNGGFGSTGE